MGLRDWFRSRAAVSDDEGPSAPPLEDESVSAEAFADLQEQKTKEALSLFDEPEEHAPISEEVEAPYDASESTVDDLLEKHMDAGFTHVDEVQIEDVAALDDPYLSATVEGDVPDTVVFETHEIEDVV
jgi:hypothetical protein